MRNTVLPAWLIKWLEALFTLIGLAYFVDIQTDGDIDLPHLKAKWKGFKGSRLERLLKFFAKVKWHTKLLAAFEAGFIASLFLELTVCFYIVVATWFLLNSPTLILDVAEYWTKEVA